MLADRPILLPRQLRSNEPLFMDDANTYWHVSAGTLAIFAVSLGDNSLASRRRYLFSVKAGSMLLPAARQQGQTVCKLMAVPIEPAVLHPIAATDWRDRLTDQPQHLMGAIETWIHRLGAALSDTVSAQLPTPIARHGLLLPGEVYQPPQGQVVWVRLLAGQARILGMPDLHVTPATGWMPLSSHLWLKAIATVELDICPAAQLPAAAIMLTGLHAFQTFVLQGIQQLEAQDRQQEYQRFQARSQLNAGAVTGTLQDLADVFRASAPPPVASADAASPETPLLAAAGAVGRALGITIYPPSQSEDLRRVRDPLEAIARASQIRMRQVALRDRWWQTDAGPLLAYRQDDRQPLALLPVKDTRYEIFDPQTGRRGPCDSAAAAAIAPTAYTFYRALPYRLRPWDLVQFATQGHHRELIMVFIASVAATVLGMVTPQATGILIDQAIPAADQTMILQIAGALLATAFGSTLFQLTQGIALMRLETFADANTQAAVWDRLLKLKAAFFRQYSIGDLSSRVSAISQIRQKLGNTLLKSIFSSLFSLLNLGLLFYYSVPLALVATGVAAINIAVTVVSGILTLKKLRPLIDQQGKLFGMMVQIINGVAKFRVAGAEPRAFAYWGRQYSQQLRLTLASEGIEDALAIANSLLSTLTPAVLFAFTTTLMHQSAAEGGFSTGTFLAFNAAFGTFISGATNLSTTIVDVLDVLPIWQRAQPILTATPEVDPSKADPGRISGQVTIDHVSFRYRSDGGLILDDVSIQVEPGEFVALVGPSGSGKSTLFRLLLGFDTPEFGNLYFDGQDMAGLDLNALRRQFGVVLQTSRLMSASIFENIASSAMISMEEAWEAARMAGLDRDITAMPMGMHTVVSEGGTNLSGGQRQRLLIARALALRPRILLFDEATSALDNHTQAVVSESLDRLKVTRLVVAHRLSTIRNADRIYVLEKGRVVQQGCFDELAAQSGLFSQLIKRQQV